MQKNTTNKQFIKDLIILELLEKSIKNYFKLVEVSQKYKGVNGHDTTPFLINDYFVSLLSNLESSIYYIKQVSEISTDDSERLTDDSESLTDDLESLKDDSESLTDDLESLTGDLEASESYPSLLQSYSKNTIEQLEQKIEKTKSNLEENLKKIKDLDKKIDDNNIINFIIEQASLFLSEEQKIDYISVHEDIIKKDDDIIESLYQIIEEIEKQPLFGSININKYRKLILPINSTIKIDLGIFKVSEKLRNEYLESFRQYIKYKGYNEYDTESFLINNCFSYLRNVLKKCEDNNATPIQKNKIEDLKKEIEKQENISQENLKKLENEKDKKIEVSVDGIINYIKKIFSDQELELLKERLMKSELDLILFNNYITMSLILEYFEEIDELLVMHELTKEQLQDIQLLKNRIQVFQIVLANQISELGYNSCLHISKDSLLKYYQYDNAIKLKLHALEDNLKYPGIIDKEELTNRIKYILNFKQFKKELEETARDESYLSRLSESFLSLFYTSKKDDHEILDNDNEQVDSSNKNKEKVEQSYLSRLSESFLSLFYTSKKDDNEILDKSNIPTTNIEPSTPIEIVKELDPSLRLLEEGSKSNNNKIFVRL